MDTKVDELVNKYRALAGYPALASARIQCENIVNVAWSQRNLEKGKTTKFCSSFFLKEFQKLEQTPPVDISNELLAQFSPSNNLKAVFTENDGKQFLEVFKKNSLLRSVDLSAADVHGNVYTDVEFGSLDFAPDENSVVYVVEKKTVKTEPFYKRKQRDPTQKTDNNAPPTIRGQEYLFEQDWGEQLIGKKSSVIAQYNIEKDTVEILPGIPEDVCVAQVKYNPDGTGVIGVAYHTKPRKLGLIYCTNRLSTIFQLDFNGNYIELNLPNRAVKSPIFSPDGKKLLWLERKEGGPHMATMALLKVDMPLTKESTPETLVGVVHSSTTTTNNRPFYGLYNSGFPKRPWASNDRLLLSTNQKYTVNSYVVNINTGDITELVGGDDSHIIVDVFNDTVLVLKRDFLTPDVLAIGHLTQEDTLDLVDLTEKHDISSFKNVMSVNIDLKGGDFNAIYVGPCAGESGTVPMVVWPHGGPHSAFFNYYALEIALFLSLGYSVLLINFRGSIGSGEDLLNSLPGNVGIQDVEDCIHSVDYALSKFPWINPNQLALCGGSHGGFLVTHLSGQYPDKFKAVVARNPVIDIASMSVISDIPDWCLVEAGYQYTQEGAPDDAALVKMRTLSPIVHAHKVKAPTLLQIGSKDLRVPPSQGVEYYTRLKANGIKVRMNLYDDNHPLGSVPNELDNIINTLLWIEEHVGSK